MKASIILAALICLAPSLAMADGPPGPDDGTCHWVKVCRPKKKLPPPVVVVPKPIIEYRDRECPPVPPTIITVTRLVPKLVFVPVVVQVAKPVVCNEWKKVSLGVYGMLGVGVRDPFVSGEVGLQLEVPVAYLGLRAFSELQYGVGFQGLIYAYRGPRVKVHVIDPGVLITGDPFRYESASDVKRRVDLILGVGVQVRLICHLELLVDYRVNIPDPAVLARNDGLKDCSGCGTPGGVEKALNARNVVGNAFAESQLKLGLLVHF